MRVFIAAAAAAVPLAAAAGPQPQNLPQYSPVLVSVLNGSNGAENAQNESISAANAGLARGGVHHGNPFQNPPPFWGTVVYPGPGPVMGTVIQPHPPYVGTAVVPIPTVTVMGTAVAQPLTIPLWTQGGYYPAPPPPVPYWGIVALPGGGGPVMGTVVNPGGQYLGTAVAPSPQFQGLGVNPNAQYQGVGVSPSPQFSQGQR